MKLTHQFSSTTKVVLLFTILNFGFSFVYSQSGAFGYKQLTEKQKNIVSSFHLPNQTVYRDVITKNNWRINHENKTWIYFSAKASELDSLYVNGELPDFYIEYAPPHVMNDSMRMHHNIDPVHIGTGLSSPYKGEGVLIGLVDTGIEIGHPDFKDENGKTRILRIWEQGVNTGSTPSEYGYGIIWDSTQINGGTCTHVDYSGHGSTVAGASASNGNATGYNQGAAPEADIIMVQTDFNLPNWTETVADACDYIFKVADSLGKKAVVNLSVGTYLGSHDGTDAAGMRINDLLDEKDGRIVVAACGNSGNIGKYHCQDIINSDTSFVWFENNPSSSFGANKIFFDLYSDMGEASYSYTFKALNPSNYETRSMLNSRLATASIGTPIFDTLWNEFNQQIATVEIYTEQEGGNFHMQVLFSNVDSTSYLYGFYTTGSGAYDLWSGEGLGLNKIVEILPSVGTFPSIIHYNLPDSLQTIVSSWNCSPKVVSVGNTKNRSGYMSYAGTYFAGDANPVGKLSPNSSKGPNRNNRIKPDITASGDLMLSAAPLWYIADAGNYPAMDSGGWHMRNGGTSMSSPVVAGIAALFLERCEKGNYASFLNAIQNYSSSNTYTGTLPNNAYGYGVVDAYQILLNQEFSATLSGDTILCLGTNPISINTSPIIGSVDWSNGTQNITCDIDTAGIIYADVYNENGCGVATDTLTITQLSVATINPITVSDDYLIYSTSSSNNQYQWTLNGVDIPGETNDSLVLDSFQEGIYDCYTSSGGECVQYAGNVDVFLGISSVETYSSLIYPNPFLSSFKLLSDENIESIQLRDLKGKEIKFEQKGDEIYPFNCASGVYILSYELDHKVYYQKLIKK